MAGRVAVDTTLLVDFQRERSREDPDGPAHRYLADDPSRELFVSATALGEFGEGFEDHDDPLLRSVRELHVLMPIDERTALTYARLTRNLRASGRMIGTNDLWIAASSLRHDLPLVTANVAEFRRVDGLQVVAYR